MEKKENKKFVKQIILICCIVLVGISIIFTNQITDLTSDILEKKFHIYSSSDNMIIHFINVGQGDAIAIQLPNSQIMLIDTGSKTNENILVEYINQTVLKDKRDKTVDYLILTHPDEDHIGGTSAIFAEFDVKNFYRPNIGCVEESEQFSRYINSAIYSEVIQYSKDEKGLNTEIICDGLTIEFEDLLVEFYGPLKTYTDLNQTCSIIKITYKDKSYLFTGDIEGVAELDIIEQYGDLLNCEILKVSHHGSENGTSLEFIKRANPQYAVISVGPNSYGHPALEVINNLQNNKVTILRTDKIKSSAIKFRCNENVEIVGDTDVDSRVVIKWFWVAIVIEAVLIFVLAKDIIKNKKLEKQAIEKDSSI